MASKAPAEGADSAPAPAPAPEEGPEGRLAATTAPSPGEDSSDSDGETEPARSFHRKISTNKDIKCSVGSCGAVVIGWW